MRILVTGGTGVVGAAAVDALVRRGHTVRLLSRHADDDVAQWPKGVEPWAGSVSDAAAVKGAPPTATPSCTWRGSSPSRRPT